MYFWDFERRCNGQNYHFNHIFDRSTNCKPSRQLLAGSHAKLWGEKENPIEGCNFMCILTEIIKRASFQYWSVWSLKALRIATNLSLL